MASIAQWSNGWIGGRSFKVVITKVVIRKVVITFPFVPWGVDAIGVGRVLAVLSKRVPMI